MNSAALAQSAYGDASPLIPLGRDTEYRAFARVTRQLAGVSSQNTNFPALASSLHENMRLWAVLAEDVASSRNELPAQLRAQLFYLFEFTKTQSQKILAGDATTEVLVEVNTAIMRGLRSHKVDS